MALKNYTSQVSAARSIAHIEDMLVAHKATQVLKKYAPGGRIEAIAFIVPIEGVEIPFRLPARVDQCLKVLKSAVRRPHAETYKRLEQQAERTAWKIVSDWVEAQMAMIDLAQVQLMEVFLPYVYNHNSGQTYFQTLEARGFQNLLPAVCATRESQPVENQER